jgi:flagellar hook-associated protein 2
MATNTITALGAGSGIDVKALAQSLVDAERTPAKALIDKRVAQSTANISGYSAIKYVLDALKTAFADLKNQSSFNSLAPTNNQPSALSVAAGSTAMTGSHTVEVTQLATPQRSISAGFATTSSVLNGGVPFSLAMSVNGGPATAIAVTDTSPAGVATAINNAGLGVTAQIVNTGEAGAPYKIMVTGANGEVNKFSLTSVDNGQASLSAVTTQGSSTAAESSALTFGADLIAGQKVTLGGLTYTATEPTTAAELAAAFASLADGATTGAATTKGTFSGTLTGFSTGPASLTSATVTATSTNVAKGNVTDILASGTAIADMNFGLTPLQAAKDAVLKVDGMSVTSSSNTVKDAISGATLNLTTTTSGVATLNFTRDTTSVKAKVQAVVTAYNDAMSMLGVVSDPKSTVASYGASLVGNSTVSQIRNQMRAIVMGQSSSPAGGLSNLSDLGVSTDSSTGQLKLDATKFDTVMNTKFDSVVTMFSANRENLSTYSTWTAGVAGDGVKKLTALLATTGSLTTQSTNATSKLSTYAKDLAKLEARMASLLARYNQQFAVMDSIVGQSTALRTSLTNTFASMLNTGTSTK